jgi:hypothetical protein
MAPSLQGGGGRSGIGKGGVGISGDIVAPSSAIAAATSSGVKLEGKYIVTTIENGIKIMEAKRKWMNPGWKP